MKEVKSPKKPLLYYYGIVLLIIALFNLLVTPLLNRRSIEEVDYGTFMSKIEAQQIEKVEIDDDEIYYTEKGGKTVYCTGIMDDPGLTERLYASGATFSRDVQKTMSPLLSFFLTSIVPLLLFLALGRYVGRKLVEQAGGKNAMASVRATPRSMCSPRPVSTSAMWQARTRPRRALRRSSIICTIRRSTPMSAPPCQRASCSSALREPARPCWPRLSRVRRMCRSSLFLARNSSRCSWAWAHQRCAICSVRPRKRPRASCSSMRSTPSAKSVMASSAATTSGSRP